MKHLFLFLFTLTFLNGYSQTTIFSENCNSPASTTSCSTYTGWQNFGFTSYGASAVSPDVRTTVPSSGYIGASGGGNIFFNNSNGIYIQFSNINTSNYTNLSLSFGILKTTNASNGSELVVEASTNGNTYTPLSYTLSTGTGTSNFYTLKTPTGTIPSTGNLRLRFRYSSTTSTCQFRIDDIKLVGCLVPTAPIVTYTSPSCMFDIITVPSNTFIQTTSNGTNMNPINVLTTSGTYYARTVSTTIGCSSVWSNPTTLSVVINQMPTITQNPVSSLSIFNTNTIYNFIAHADSPFIWQISMDNGNTWAPLTIATPYSTKGDTLSINFTNISYQAYNGYQYRIASSNSSCTAYSTSGTLITTSVLPIELIGFYIERFFDLNKVSWLTASEVNLNRFEIERSNDIKHWESIGSVIAMGNTTSRYYYTFYDNYPLKGLNYYRLKSVDDDGYSEYSPVVALNYHDSETQKKYYTLMGVEVSTLLPDTYYILVEGGVAKKIFITK